MKESTAEYDRQYSEINETILAPLRPPRTGYVIAVALLATTVCWAAICWTYQINYGMGVSGLGHPVGWGVYIANFVFWVGIAHSGTLISAILFLVRSRWRAAIARSAEAMTVFAVMTAGLFPLIHLGRLWVVYFILPYPSLRQLWPNFLSPLVWDVVAVSTYFTVSSIFLYVGMIPDLASARDRCRERLGNDHPHTWLYRIISLGWTGAGNQWRHHGRSYLFFAALATPLVISVHSVVSWDFAMGLLPGWHTTIFAPYFVAGAIHSGLAMVLTLMIPMRYLLRLEKYVTIDHFRAVAETMLVTTAIVGYAYLIEPFMAWYSGDLYEQQFALWRAVGWMRVVYWSLFLLNVLAPMLFISRRMRTNITALLIVSILVNVGMWLERVLIVVGSTAHDFMPHNWGHYWPSWVEISITVGAFAWFFLLFTLFTKICPTASISDVKEDYVRGDNPHHDLVDEEEIAQGREGTTKVWAVYEHAEQLVEALKKVLKAGCGKAEVYSPRRLHETEAILGCGPSTVRVWTLIGALSGCIGGFTLAIYAASVNQIIAGGKPAVSLIPFCIVGFEGTILLGTIGNFLGMLFNTKLGRVPVPEGYDPRLSRDRYGMLIACPAENLEKTKSILDETEAEKIHVVG